MAWLCAKLSCASRFFHHDAFFNFRWLFFCVSQRKLKASHTRVSSLSRSKVIVIYRECLSPSRTRCVRSMINCIAFSRITLRNQTRSLQPLHVQPKLQLWNSKEKPRESYNQIHALLCFWIFVPELMIPLVVMHSSKTNSGNAEIKSNFFFFISGFTFSSSLVIHRCVK